MADQIAPKGKYRLLSHSWKEIVSKAGEPVDWVIHYGDKHPSKGDGEGDMVDLSAADAERLLRSGGVAPTTDAQAKSAAAQAPNADQAKIDASYVPPVPAPVEGAAAPAPGK